MTYQDVLSIVAGLAYLGLPPSRGAPVWSALEPYFPNEFGDPDLVLEAGNSDDEEQVDQEEEEQADGEASERWKDDGMEEVEEGPEAGFISSWARRDRTGPAGHAAEVAALLAVAACSGWDAPSTQLLPNLVDVVRSVTSYGRMPVLVPALWLRLFV
jgi:hypothetical protein